jgi:deoxyribonuclease-4
MDDRASGLARNADAVAEALARAPGRTVLCLETTAGQGTVLGATFEELAALIDRLPAEARGRVGVCLDTCHVYSPATTWRTTTTACGRASTTCSARPARVLHLNDSKAPFGSRKDRHELIAEGSLGAAPFRG